MKYNLRWDQHDLMHMNIVPSSRVEHIQVNWIDIMSMYVNSKTKRTERIGDLKVKNEQDETVICTSAKSKADSLCIAF